MTETMREFAAQQSFLRDVTGRLAQAVPLTTKHATAKLRQRLVELMAEVDRELPARTFAAREALLAIAAAAWQTARDCRIEDELPG